MITKKTERHAILEPTRPLAIDFAKKLDARLIFGEEGKKRFPKPRVSDSTRNQFKAGQLWLTQQKSSEIVRALTPCLALGFSSSYVDLLTSR